MPPRQEDLLRLTRLAENASGAIGPVLLRVQADLFAGAPVRDAPTIAAFEALALAILPRSDADTASYVARRVSHLRETPQSVLSLLPTRDADEAQGRALQALVDEARADGALAATLLARDDVPAGEAARLYLHADADRRARIRSALAASGEAAPARLARPARPTIDGLVDAALARDVSRFSTLLSEALGVRSSGTPWRLSTPARRELLALALVAVGAPEEDCVRIFLTLDRDMARSVEAVFGLVEIVRRTPRSVAIRLLEAALDLRIAIAGRAAPRPEEASRETRERLAGRPATPRQALAAAAGIDRGRAAS